MKKTTLLFIVFILFLSFSFTEKIFSIIPGDGNNDGKVNGADYIIWLNNYGSQGSSNGDFNSDGKVDGADYIIWLNNYGKIITPTPSGSTTNYYVAPSGNDTNIGTSNAPFKTIQKALSSAKTSVQGATIHILPGIYREALLLDNIHGTASNPITLVAENGSNSVYIYGSENSQDSRITWSKNTTGASFPTAAVSHIYSADINVWGAIPELAYDTTNAVTRLPKAREPDWNVTTEWKYHENWWKADSASGTTLNTLIDATNDAVNSYPEANQSQGNLKSINGFTGNFLTGGRLFFKDSQDGHDLYNAAITSHDGSVGKITFDKELDHPAGKPSVGPYTKYYVEGAPQLLDQPGEWYVNPTTKKLYIWPPNDTNPASLKLEFATRLNAIQIKNSSYVIFKNINIDFTNYAYATTTGPDGAIRFYGYADDQTHHITFDGVKVQHNGIGFRLYQSNGSTTSTGSLSYVFIKNSLVDDSDGYAMMVWHWPVPSPTPFIHHLWIENTEFGHMGFRGTGVGIFMQHPERIVFLNNYLHHSSHNAIEIQSGKGSGNSMVLVQNNLSENNCLNGSDCGAFKFWNLDTGTGTKNIAVINNIFRGTKGWSYVNQAQNKKNSPVGYGAWGNGYYSDVVFNSTPGQGCSITVFRNLIYDNAAAGVHLTRSNAQCIVQNVIAQNGDGIEMNNYSPTTDGSFNNKITGNIITFSESANPTAYKAYGISARINKADEGKLQINNNQYKIVGSNSYDMFKQDIEYTNVASWKTINDIRNNTPWEDNGRDTTVAMPSLPTGSNTDITQYENAYGISNVSVPSDVKTIIATLQNDFGIPIPPAGTIVGRN